MRDGVHPVHSRLAWQVWATERLMDMARSVLFPIYASLFTPVWLRLLGAKVGRDVEASTVLAVPSMTTIAAARSWPTTRWSRPTNSTRAGCTSPRRASASRRSWATPGMTAPGHAVPKRGLIGVLSSAPRRSKKGSSWLGSAADAAAPGPQRRRHVPHLRAADEAQGRPGFDRGRPGGPGDGRGRARGAGALRRARDRRGHERLRRRPGQRLRRARRRRLWRPSQRP